jgi:hypothetical protein
MEPLRRLLNYHSCKNLSVFRRLQHDPRGILAAIHRLAFPSIRPRLNINIGIRKFQLELRIAALADAGDVMKPDSTADGARSQKIEAAT